MWFLTRMYPEAYYWACAVDEDTAHLILQACDSDEIAGKRRSSFGGRLLARQWIRRTIQNQFNKTTASDGR